MSAKIAKALHQVMSSVGYIQKTGKNQFHGYRYAGEADLLEKLRPAMLEAGLLLIPSIKTVSPIDEHGVTTVQVEYTLAHKDGEIWPEKIGAAGQGGDRAKNGSVGDKGLYKAITGANKYLLFKLFQIETGDDPENDSGGNDNKRENPHVTRPSDVTDAAPRFDAKGNRIDWIDTTGHRVERLTKAKARPVAELLNKTMRMAENEADLVEWGVEHSEQVASLPEDWETILQGRYQEHLDALRERKAA